MKLIKSSTKIDLLLLILVGFISLYIVAFESTTASDDTLTLISATSNMLVCLRQGVYSSCPGMWHFPLSQFISSAFFIVLGFSNSQVLSALISLNLAAYIASLLLFYTAGSRWAGKPAAALLAAVLLSGYGLPYSSFSFNESVALFLITAFVFGCLFKWHGAILFLFNIAAGITKEIAPPFLLAMGLIVFVINWDKNNAREQIKYISILCLGFLISVSINGAFNFFRYASFQNVQLLSKAYVVPNAHIWWDYFLMLIFSPNGGLLSAWPTWCAFCFILMAQASWTLKRNNHSVFIRSMIPLVGFAGLLLILQIGLAKWWAPFGSTAWGPRLTLPYLGGLLLIICAADTSNLRLVSNQLLSNRKTAIIMGYIVGVLSIPHILMVIVPEQVVNLPMPSTTNANSSLVPALGVSFFDLIPHGEGEVLTKSWQYYYLIAREEAWLNGSLYIAEFSLLKNFTTLWKALLYTGMFPLLFISVQSKLPASAVDEKSKAPLSTQKAWHLLSIVSIIGLLVIVGVRLRPALKAQWLGFSPAPEHLINKAPTDSTKCGFIQYSLTIRELGLITNISIEPQFISHPMWATDSQDGVLSLWVVKKGETQPLLNLDNGSVRIPVVEKTTLLLYGAKDCHISQDFEKMKILVRYSDNRTPSTVVIEK